MTTESLNTNTSAILIADNREGTLCIGLAPFQKAVGGALQSRNLIKLAKIVRESPNDIRLKEH